IAVDVNRRHLVSPHRGATMYHSASRMLAVRSPVPSRHSVTPEGYRRMDWAEAERGQTVWLAGWEGGRVGEGEVVAFGPFTVVDARDRSLRSGEGRVFQHHPKDLLVSEA
ncbi:MAG: hypothetical protein ACE5EX_08675, partial [Phycisphaerae bacterium]